MMIDEPMKKALAAIRQEINSRPVTDFVLLTKSKGTDMYNCPICGSGTGKNRTGALKLYRDTNRIICNANGCFGAKGEDTLGALRIIWDCTEAEAMKRAGYELEAYKGKQPQKAQQPQKTYEEREKDYTDYFQQMAANLEGAAEYLSSRHISLATARRFNLGYDVRWINPKTAEERLAKGERLPPASRRLIIPTSKASYLARATDPDADPAYSKQKVGKVHLFNTEALHNAEKRPVFITEGEIDALSIIEAGGIACGLGSTTSAEKLVAHLKDNPTESALLLALDNDEAGRKATEDLEKKLAEAGKKAGIDFATVTIYGSAKDANEALCCDPDGFQMAIRAEEAKHRPGAGMVQSFLQAISSRKYEPIPTGLEPLDDAIGGGFLRQTLVMMGAAPGMGKSFFAQQLFEGMAQNGHNVLYFNLEMSREQMLARSFARIARQREGATMTAMDVLQGYRWTYAQRAIVERTAAAYSADIAPHMAYNPGGSTAQLDVILEQMKAAAQRAANAGKEAPLVVIDYLHLLRGDKREDVQTTVKRAMDAFKGYAMRFNSVVFVILAFNRESNKGGKISQESARDSSAIEYSADLMLGLNFSKVEENKDSDLLEKVREAAQQEGKTKGYTDYKLKVLKSRLQGDTGSIDLIFSGKYGLFMPKYDKRSGWQTTDEPTPFKRI